MALKDFINGINDIQGALNGTALSPTPNSGFTVPAGYSADGNGLPYSKVSNQATGSFTRNIMTWFVPEFGTVRMYINPERLSYSHKKIINKERTKGGFSLQYWGEDLSELSISGTTGSSGIEGINMLYEIYRAEQYAFDSYGLTLEAQNGATGLGTNLSNAVGDLFGGDNQSLVGEISGFVGDVTGINSANANLAAQNIPSLAQLAFTLEMYYAGSVHRGYISSMTVNEKADNFLIDYSISFVITQKRGYRTNYFPFHKSPVAPREYDTPNSFNGKIK